MPCESAAAGLIALGSMSQRLMVEGSNDLISHYKRIERAASDSPNQIYLRRSDSRGRFLLEHKSKDGMVWARSEPTYGSRSSNRMSLKQRRIILPPTAFEWHFDGEGPVQMAHGAELPHHGFYKRLMTNAEPLPSNLMHSDSAICLAGRVGGGSVSKDLFSTIRFQIHDYIADLSQLLTIHNWSPRTISRMTFFNSRTGNLDRNTGLTRLVVADGDAALLRVIETPEFRSSDVIGVIQRAIERERLEAIGIKLSELAQWYVPDSKSQKHFLPAPTGITASFLERR